ncbi:helix-turn-helix domain-containing protein [Agrobacterium salinitolerans]|uniref:helix-turn-helix domain-containing protein n=1 Tax=Agrobacterium salinitolerans TaxID=1183413 RepID=UPI001574107D|nr:helix-turn-helix domain-containing protein [Agrobacterium salinitolerans]NTA35994.1 helix-turn-helix domain-containing protein [Agrobacterium salinitolerans]
MKASNDNLKDDILKGADAIAEFIGEDRRAVYHLVKKGSIPTFRLGENIRARKSTLLAWIAQQEAGVAA